MSYFLQISSASANFFHCSYCSTCLLLFQTAFLFLRQSVPVCWKSVQHNGKIKEGETGCSRLSSPTSRLYCPHQINCEWQEIFLCRLTGRLEVSTAKGQIKKLQIHCCSLVDSQTSYNANIHTSWQTFGLLVKVNANLF